MENGGPGTAQSLGNERTIEDILGTSAPPPADLRWATRHRHPATVGGRPASRGRTSNSSSEESFFTEIPTSVLHPNIHAVRGSLDADPPTHPFVRFGSSATHMSGSYSTTSRRRPRPQLHLSSFIGRTLGSAGGGGTAAGSTGPSNLSGPLGGSLPVAIPGDYSSINLSSSQYPGVTTSMRTSSMGSGSSLNRIRFLTGLAGLAAGRRAEDRQSLRFTKRKQFYRVNLCPFISKTSKIRLDRLRLTALFDQNRSRFSAACDVSLAVLVSLALCLLLRTSRFLDLSLIALCAVAAGCQFSLLKSVQPDAASPVHGYNWLVSYSRPVYFCLVSATILSLDYFAARLVPGGTEPSRVTIYGVELSAGYGILLARNFFAAFILILPLFFTLGLLPQLNTFITHTLEQMDMLIFGGTATFGLISAIYSISRSFVCAAVLFALCQFGLQQADTVQQSVRSVAYSAFCGLMLAVSFALSRTSSNHRILLNLVTHILPSNGCRFGTTVSNPTVAAASSSTDVNANTIDLANSDIQVLMLRLKNDFLVSILLAVLAFALHCSTVFTKLQPALFYVSPCVTVAVGVLAHYFWPQFRKHTPFLSVAQPIMRSQEHGT